MITDYWQKRCEAAEERLTHFYQKTVNPPIAILEINYKDQAEKQHAKLKKFRHLIGRLYWKSK